jgi:hypothetical protein
MIEVRKDVIAATRGAQVPWDHSALTGDFYFRPGKAGAIAGSAEIAALSDRAKALEAELRARADAETIARLTVLKERRRDLERRLKEARDNLFDRQRSQLSERDSQRQRQITQEIFAAQRRIGDVQAELRKTNEEIVAIEAKSQQQPLVPKGGVQQAAAGTTAQARTRRFADFTPARRLEEIDVYSGARLDGQILGSANSETIDACAASCRAEAGCVAFAMEARTGLCEHYRSVDRLRKDAAWSAGVRN